MCTLVTKEAPNFTAKAVMPDNSFADLKLSAYRGRYVVLFFYPLDFTFVCPSEIIAFDAVLAKFEKKNAQVIGVSVDSHYTHLAWKNTPRKEGGSITRWLPTLTRAFRATSVCCWMAASPCEGCS